jgi:hypothetical protein
MHIPNKHSTKGDNTRGTLDSCQASHNMCRRKKELTTTISIADR